jgi:hypothetical protein
MSPTHQQFARVQRYLARLRRAGATDDDYDDLLSLFMHAWHLADWMSHDPAVNRQLSTIHKDAQEETSNQVVR